MRVPDPTAPTPPEISPPPPAGKPPVTGALFRRATDALAFIAAVSGAGIAGSIACQRDAFGRWGIEVPCPPRQVAPLAVTARGRPFVGGPPVWRVARSDGQARPGAAVPGKVTVTTLVDGAHVESLEHWRSADLRQLLAGV